MSHYEAFSSLLNYFPGVSKVDPGNTSIMCRRDVSAEWLRGGYTSVDPAGFNPFFGKVFYSRYSCLDELNNNAGDVAPNLDLFKYEVFYALHDFVHVWSLHELAGMNRNAIGSWDTIDDIDPMWFKLLLLFSEAAATVAVDYWLLSSRSLPVQLNSKNAFTTLTTPFNANRDSTQIEGNPHGVEIRSPEFLVQMALAYCLGWTGPVSDLMSDFGCNPPAWLTRECNQARRQTKLTNHWLMALHGATVSEVIVEREHFEAIRPQLLHLATELLCWLDSGYIKEPKIHMPIVGWCDQPPYGIDFRFINVPKWFERGGKPDKFKIRGDNLAYFNAQVVSQVRPCQLLDFKKRYSGKTLTDISSADLVAAIEGVPRLSNRADGPLNLFFIS